MSTKKKSDLIPRVITAIVALPLLVALISMAPAWAFFLFILLAGAISIWEYCGITFARDHAPGRIVTIALGLGLMNVLYFAQDFFLPALIATLLGLFLYYLFFFKDQKKVSHQIASSFVAIIYGGILLTFMPLMARDSGLNGEGGWMWVIMALAIVWSSDTGAYFAGKTLGKRKLYPAVSPNKSVEGAIGGLLTTIAFTYGFDALFTHFFPDLWTSLSTPQILILAVPANILGQCGDLAESLIKRAHDVKDSGSIIYGHGGILDRIDALLFAAPWVYYFSIYGLELL